MARAAMSMAQQGVLHGLMARTHLELVLRGPIVGGRTSEFLQEHQVEAIFERAEVLAPSQPHGDLLGLDEEARKEEPAHAQTGTSIARKARRAPEFESLSAD